MSQKCLGEEGLTDEELLAVVAHELGHWYYEDEWSFVLFYSVRNNFIVCAKRIKSPFTIVLLSQELAA